MSEIGSSYSWFLITQNLESDLAIMRVKHKFVKDNESLSY